MAITKIPPPPVVVDANNWVFKKWFQDLYEYNNGGVLVPSGGTSGQVLTKSSSTDFDVSWGTASSGSSDFQIINKVVCVGGETTISFSNIPQTFNELRIIVYGRDTGAVADNGLRIKVNGDATSTNYEGFVLQGVSGTTSSSTGTPNADGAFIANIPGISSNTNAIGHSEIIIPGYAGTNFYKQLAGRTMSRYTTSYDILIYEVMWKSNSAITSLTLKTAGSGLAAGTTAVLYGVGGTGSTVVSTSSTAYTSSQFRWLLSYGADATPVNRPAFQSSSGTFTSINSIPPTGQTTSLVQVYNDPLMANCAYGDIRITSAVFSITTNTLGTGTQLPMAFTVGTEAMRIATSKNLMIGTTTDGMTAGGSLAIAQDLAHRGTKVGFNNATPITKPTVTGSRGGNVALASLLTALANLGLITDSTTA